MATLNFIRISEETEKAVKVVVREAGYDLTKFKAVSEKYFWIPKSVVKIEGNTATVADWFYEKNIAVDAYSAFMRGLANS
jgi:hypothetical protein